VDAVGEVESVIFLAIFNHCHLKPDPFEQFGSDHDNSLGGEFVEMTFDDLGCDIPDEGDLTGGYFVDEGLEIGLIEVIIDSVAQKIEGTVTGCWMHVVGESESDPMLTFAGNLVDLIIVVG
jgi:hypothetical protein